MGPPRRRAPRPMRAPGGSALAALLLPVPAVGLDNGLGITPPRGWRSWNAYDCMAPARILTDGAMRGAMRGVVDGTRAVGGRKTSLAELGFGWVSMDDGWQQCNCSVRQDEDPALPKCTVDECFGGKCTWHDAAGAPRVNAHRFPDMKALVDYGHSLGLKVGGYLNTCICTEAGQVPTHYEQDVEWFMAAGFDEVKVDNCGLSRNVTRWAELFNSTGKPVRIENCHNSVPDPQRPEDCPMHMYRSGGDIGASFDSILGEAYSTIPFGDRPEGPLSRPGCWAYPDMLEVGNFEGPEPLRSDEERSHYGLWSVVSSPLILGLNLTDAAAVDRVWDTITNPHALAVNAEWVGHPGTLVRSYPATGVEASQIGQAVCGGRQPQQGWRLWGGFLVAPGSAPDAMLCVDPSTPLPDEPQVYANPCPPPTTGGGQVDCGLTVVNCSRARGNWTYEGARGLLMWQAQLGDKPRCLSATPQELTQVSRLAPSAWARTARRPPWQLEVGDGRRSPATVQLVDCPEAGKPPQPSSVFVLDEALRLRVRREASVCLTVAPMNGVQLWAKPLSGGKVAALLVNVLRVPQALSVPLADVPGLRGEDCSGFDVWRQRAVELPGRGINVSLASHESAFLILSCASRRDGAVEDIVQLV